MPMQGRIVPRHSRTRAKHAAREPSAGMATQPCGWIAAKTSEDERDQRAQHDRSRTSALLAVAFRRCWYSTPRKKVSSTIGAAIEPEGHELTGTSRTLPVAEHREDDRVGRTAHRARMGPRCPPTPPTAWKNPWAKLPWKNISTEGHQRARSRPPAGPWRTRPDRDAAVSRSGAAGPTVQPMSRHGHGDHGMPRSHRPGEGDRGSAKKAPTEIARGQRPIRNR